ncbi:hydroxysteroid 11-beta-dehydrogenase 1-like protein A [Eublepharis macularius]|uniref:Hydroxysteroid 11-beta-dehydrogenase 1-like protein A n=1 Tax=Eublepharis macularius TaxID=481883 RepID=A0AA97K936_EUBMA|nr:hydroxysteroid 11-beta-dehydrogenase 1-like protein A [Eublepharis macularius]
MAVLKILLPLIVGLCAYYFYSQESFSAEMVRGKRVLVTGSSTGIGEQIAYEFARMGANVAVTARREKQLQMVVQKCLELGASSASYIVSDMSNLTSAQKVIEETKSKLGGLDYLVLNHVGGNVGLHLFRGDMEIVKRSMNLNFFSYVQLTISALNMLQESGGSIIVMSSMAGRIMSPFTLEYSAAKFAVEGFYSGLRTEMRLRKINLPITVAVLGYINTDNAMKEVSNKMTMEPSSKEECAKEVVKGGVLRRREVIYPYWSQKFILILRDLMPNLVDQLVGKSYKLENIS